MAGMLRAVGMGQVRKEGSHEFLQRLLSHHGLLHTLAPDSCDNDKNCSTETVPHRAYERASFQLFLK